MVKRSVNDASSRNVLLLLLGLKRNVLGSVGSDVGGVRNNSGSCDRRANNVVFATV